MEQHSQRPACPAGRLAVGNAAPFTKEKYEKGKRAMSSETIELSGHIIDSWTLPRAWDVIMDRGGNFTVEEMRIGIHKTEPSYARMRVEAPDDHTLELILTELQQFGAILVD